MHLELVQDHASDSLFWLNMFYVFDQLTVDSY